MTGSRTGLIPTTETHAVRPRISRTLLTGRWYRGATVTETAAIVISLVGTGIGIVGVMGLMLRILTMNIGKPFEANGAQMKELKADLGARIDETNRRIDETNRQIDETNRRFDNRFEHLTSEMHQRFDRVHQELAENRERMANLEGALEGFLAGRRDRDAA